MVILSPVSCSLTGVDVEFAAMLVVVVASVLSFCCTLLFWLPSDAAEVCIFSESGHW